METGLPHPCQHPVTPQSSEKNNAGAGDDDSRDTQWCRWCQAPLAAGAAGGVPPSCESLAVALARKKKVEVWLVWPRGSLDVGTATLDRIPSTVSSRSSTPIAPERSSSLYRLRWAEDGVTVTLPQSCCPSLAKAGPAKVLPQFS